MRINNVDKKQTFTIDVAIDFLEYDFETTKEFLDHLYECNLIDEFCNPLISGKYMYRAKIGRQDGNRFELIVTGRLLNAINDSKQILRVSDIQKITTDQFFEELSVTNYDYIKDKYLSLNNALDIYKEGALLSESEIYMGINEYFDIQRELEKEIEELKKKPTNSK